MAKLIYSAITSLDGYVSDEDGNFDWAVPDEEVHAFVNDLERGIGTYLYGRRMYDVMIAWETDDMLEGLPPVIREYADIWRAAEKVVYSTTRGTVSSVRTRIERRFDPDAVWQMKAEGERDLSVGGPHLAAQALAAGLVDEVYLLASPIVVGGGTRAFPRMSACRSSSSTSAVSATAWCTSTTGFRRRTSRLASARVLHMEKPSYVVLRKVDKDTWRVLGEVERRPGLTARAARAQAIQDATRGKATPNEEYRAVLRSEWRIAAE